MKKHLRKRSTRRSPMQGEALETRRVLTAVYGPLPPDLGNLADVELVDTATANSQTLVQEVDPLVIYNLIVDDASLTQLESSGFVSLSPIAHADGGLTLGSNVSTLLIHVDSGSSTDIDSLVALAASGSGQEIGTISASIAQALAEASTPTVDLSLGIANAATPKYVQAIAALDFVGNHRSTSFAIHGGSVTSDSDSTNTATASGGQLILLNDPSDVADLSADQSEFADLKDLEYAFDTVSAEQLSSGNQNDLGVSEPPFDSEPTRPEFGVVAKRPALPASQPAVSDQLDVTAERLPQTVSLDFAVNHRSAGSAQAGAKLQSLADTDRPLNANATSSQPATPSSSQGFAAGVLPRLARQHQITVAANEAGFEPPTTGDVSLFHLAPDDVYDATFPVVFGALTAWTDAQAQLQSLAVSADENVIGGNETMVELSDTVAAEVAADAMTVPLWQTDGAAQRWQLMVDMLLAGATGAMIYSAKLDRETAAHWTALAERFRLRPPKDA